VDIVTVFSWLRCCQHETAARRHPQAPFQSENGDKFF
jgi:hypothetical protein